MKPNYNLVKLIQNAVASLKRDYGHAISVYQGVPTTDVETGVVTRNVTGYNIRRAIVLPVRVLEAVKNLGQGGLAGRLNIIGSRYDTGKRLFIIDRRDLPVVLSLNDWIKYDERKYSLETIDEYEYHTAYLVTGVELIDEVSRSADYSVSATDAVTLTSTGTVA